MKTSFLTISLLVLAIWANAKVLTVSNDPNQPAMYTTFSDAYKTAITGDTLYLVGSSTTYQMVDIGKGISVIGSGFNNANERQLETKITDFTLSFHQDDFGNIISSSSGSKIEGIQCENIYFSASDLIQISNIEIKNCNLTRIFLTKVQSISIHNCIINYAIYASGLSTAYVENLSVKNNIIGGYMRACYSHNSSTVIANNLFLNYLTPFDDMKGANIYNNVFCYETTFHRGFSNCIMSKNISTGTQELNISDYDNNVYGENNLINTDPLFKNTPKMNAINYSYDYRLQDSSPGKNAGTDGKDIGITGGDYPWPLNEGGMLDFTGRPSLPYIEKMKILNSVVPTNGTLNVSVTVKSQN